MNIKDRYALRLAVLPAAAFFAFLTACNPTDLLDDEEETAKRPALEVTNLHFENDSKDIVLETMLTRDMGEVRLDQDSVTAVCVESDIAGVPFPERAQPAVVSVRRTATEQAIDNAIYVDVLVDLTLSEDAVEAERVALLEMRNIFPAKNMRVICMTDGGISEAYPATDYVINSYCRQVQSSGRKKLYKSIIDCVNLADDTTGVTNLNYKGVLMVFSDGQVYSNNRPIDSEHFSHQEELMRLVSSAREDSALYYVNFGEDGHSGDAGDFIRSICREVGGLFQDKFDSVEMEKHIFGRFGVNFTDYTIILRNPRYKVYDGKKRTLDLTFSKDGNVIAELHTEYGKGSFYQPVIVDGKSKRQILWFGIVIAVEILVFIYVMLQFVVPKIRKTIFDKKYIIEYQPNMASSGVVVDSSCYYCKAPFEPGERVVAKCSHTMHEQCWNENGYHCPEYGRKCRKGGHYYNPDNLLDPCNSSYHMPWVLCATFAGILSWIVFLMMEKTFSVNIITWLSLKLLKIQEGTPQAAEFIETNVDTLDQFPAFGLIMGVLLTFAISILTVHHRSRLRMLAEVSVRSLSAGMCGYISFLVGCVISAIVDTDRFVIFINWIPWTLTALAIALCSSIRTRTTPRKHLILATIVIGFVSMFLWEVVLARMGVDYRLWLLFSHVIFSVGIALSVAQAAPVSEHYFLHVSGSIKDMDIAIYKWFEANSNKVATIGRSVDCDLVMSWDVNGDIAPVQANLSREGHSIYITPLEDGVMRGDSMLPVGKKFRLTHGTALTIGKTELLYQEKDV